MTPGRPTNPTLDRRRGRRGFALILVTVVMAAAALLGYALLSDSAMRGVASANGLNATMAEAMAESGVNLAMYYLQNPTHAPSGPPASGYWLGSHRSCVTITTVGASQSIAGGFKVRVTQHTTATNGTITLDTYAIEATGVYPFSIPWAANAIVRTLTATITVTRANGAVSGAQITSWTY